MSESSVARSFSFSASSAAARESSVLRELAGQLLVDQRLLALHGELLEPAGGLPEEQLLALDPVPDHPELGEGLGAAEVELGHAGDLVDHAPPLQVAHLDDPGDVALHHHVVPVRPDAECPPRKSAISLCFESRSFM